jgi:hypothetical protein
MSNVKHLQSRRLRQIRNQVPILTRHAASLSEHGSRAHLTELRKARRKLAQLHQEEKSLMSELGAFEENVTYLPPGTSLAKPSAGWRSPFHLKKKGGK